MQLEFVQYFRNESAIIFVLFMVTMYACSGNGGSKCNLTGETRCSFFRRWRLGQRCRARHLEKVEDMIGLIQRVSEASVVVQGRTVGKIGPGLLVLIGVEKHDDETTAKRLLERLLGYRVFSDAQDKMNLSLTDIGGELLLVPQFTLAADTHKGTRPSFSSAASPELGASLFEYFVAMARKSHSRVATGVFGANMKVSLINDGPVTFWLQVGIQ